MLTIKAPLTYINQAGIITEAGSYISNYGKRAVVVGSKTSFQIAGEKLFASLTGSGIEYVKYLFEGYPSERISLEIQAKAIEFGADSIIGLGGGKVLDTTKVVGDRANLSVITIPTIAATCAAWAAVTIIYDDEGAFTGFEPNQNSPALILADADIIAAAPERYLKAGIVDTLAKFYETAPNLPFANNSLTYKQTVNTAQFAYRDLTQNLSHVLSDLRNGKVTKEVSNAIDAVIYLAGLVGSITDGFYGGFAHSFYNTITSVPGTRDKLHGEKVAFGLLVQFVLEHKTDDEIVRELQIFHKLGQPLTLKDIGMDAEDVETIERISNELTADLPFIRFLSGIGAADIKEAILKADEIGTKFSLGRTENVTQSKVGA